MPDDLSMEAHGSVQNKQKILGRLILLAQKRFCFFSIRSVVKPSVCTVEKDKAWKNTFPGFVFYCLIFEPGVLERINQTSFQSLAILVVKPVQIINCPTQIWQNCCWFLDLVDCINKLLIQQLLQNKIDFTKNVVLFLHAYFLVCFYKFFLWLACCDLPCPRCCHVLHVVECDVLSKVAHKCM